MRLGNRRTAVLTEDLKTWEAHNAIIHQCCSNALSIADEFAYKHCMGNWSGAVKYHDNITAAIRKPPDFRKRYGEALTNIAALRDQNIPDFDAAKDLYFDFAPHVAHRHLFFVD